jgi:type II secretory pathway pseudopilin PulG
MRAVYINRPHLFVDVHDDRRKSLDGEAAEVRMDCPRAWGAGQSPRARTRRVLRAFTVVEILIVVVALGILGMVVIPQFTRASQQSKQNQLKDVIQYLRTQVAVFKAQHQDIPPGYPQGNPMLSPTPDDFTGQMTHSSDVNCNFSTPGGQTYPYGPYLAAMPTNPVNGKSTVEVIGNNQGIPVADGSTGWIYKPQTQEVIANVVGKDDSGASYATY